MRNRTLLIVMLAIAAGSAVLAWLQGLLQMQPEANSTFSEEVDFALHFINGVTVFFFVGIIALMVFFAIVFRRRDPRQKAEAQTSHNTPLELSWSLPPLVIVLFMFWLGFSGFMNMATVPNGAYEIEAVASKWSWSFRYPNGVSKKDLHVPAGEDVRLVLSSEEAGGGTPVLHSLSIPNFRVKQDVVPGRYNRTWFHAKEPTPYADSGDEAQAAAHGHQLYCAEFCGTLHSEMRAKVVVHRPGWRPQPITFDEDVVSVERGKHLFETGGGVGPACFGCHATEEGGSSAAAPILAGLYNKSAEQLASGETVPVDENFDEYVRRSIRTPAADIVDGYEGAAQMPAAYGDLTEEQVDSLILYIKSLSGPVEEIGGEVQPRGGGADTEQQQGG